MKNIGHGKLIRERRKQLGYTLLELSNICSISRGFLVSVESGSRGMSNETRDIIFKNLGIVEEGGVFVGRPFRQLTETEQQRISDDIKNGRAVSTIARNLGIGLKRFYELVDTTGLKRSYNFVRDKTNKESIENRVNAIARAYWDKFNVGDIVETIVRVQHKKPILIFGKILEKKREYMVIDYRNKRTNIAFADVLSKETKIRHKAVEVSKC